MIDDTISKNVEITLSKDKNISTIQSNIDSKDIEKPLDINYNTENVFSQITLKSLFQFGKQLFPKNLEFQIIVFLFTSWIILTSIEFITALILGDPHIISDAFFNTFKTISFLITCLSILFTYIYSTNNNFIIVRIELIAALSSIIFLVIVSVYMLLQALHLITEDNIKIPPIKFLEWLSVLKVIINMIALFIFSDYILHPELQIKLYLWKFSKEWKPLNEVSIDKLKKCNNLLKKWNNHFENMNALTSSLISDLICSTLFIIFFYTFNEIYYSKGYLIISWTNFIVVIILVRDSFYSIMKILMQGKCTIYESFYSKLNQEISYFEGCQGVKEIKFWMNSQNNIKVYIKIYANKNLNRNQLKNRISEITKEIELICDYTLEIDE